MSGSPGNAAGSATGDGVRADGTSAAASGSMRASAAAAYASAAEDADLVDVASMTGRLVRVGGLVVDLRPDGFTLDDGTAIGRVVLRGTALDQLPLVEPDDALNAIGRVEATADGPVVAVDDPAGLIQAGDPVPAEASSSPAGDSAATLAGPIRRRQPVEWAGQSAGWSRWGRSRSIPGRPGWARSSRSRPSHWP